jgi:hypothetical protein
MAEMLHKLAHYNNGKLIADFTSPANRACLPE